MFSCTHYAFIDSFIHLHAYMLVARPHVKPLYYCVDPPPNMKFCKPGAQLHIHSISFVHFMVIIVDT